MKIFFIPVSWFEDFSSGGKNKPKKNIWLSLLTIGTIAGTIEKYIFKVNLTDKFF